MPTVRLPRITESAFTRQLIGFARFMGCMAYHQRPARTATGWRTALMGDAGFPDVVIVRAKPALFCVAELKVGRNKPTPAQVEWLEACRAVGIPAYLWTPDDWPEIERVLT